jgi:hypothetical protein
MCHSGIVWGLSSRAFVLGLLWLAAKGPGFLWAPAMTPRIVNVTSIEALAVPIYGADDFPTPTGPASFATECWNGTTELGDYIIGTFSSCPTVFFLSNLLAAAASANGWTPSQSRFDNTGYRYLSRSYGVGASVGLADVLGDVYPISFAAPGFNPWGSDPLPLLSYTYTEIGFNTTVQCYRGDGSGWKLSPLLIGNDTASAPALFLAEGAEYGEISQWS